MTSPLVPPERPRKEPFPDLTSGADIGDFVQEAAWRAVLARVRWVVLLVLFLALLAVTAAGKAIGDALGHGDIGAAVTFWTVMGLGLAALWRFRPEGQPLRYGRALALGALGVGLLLLSRALGTAPAAPWVGMVGFLSVLSAPAWAFFAPGVGEREEDLLVDP